MSKHEGDLNIIEQAARVCVQAHGGQVRKGDGQPYLVHPVMVALKLAQHGFPDAVIAAVLVHDVLEDTDYPEERFRAELGDEVYTIVKAVTHNESLPWEEKKMQYIEQVRKGTEGAKAIAIADKIHNLESLFLAHAEQGVEVWKRFNRGKEKKLWFEQEVLEMLKETWPHPLVDEYARLLEKEKNLE